MAEHAFVSARLAEGRVIYKVYNYLVAGGQYTGNTRTLEARIASQSTRFNNAASSKEFLLVESVEFLAEETDNVWLGNNIIHSLATLLRLLQH
jgi:hypothetical protein